MDLTVQPMELAAQPVLLREDAPLYDNLLDSMENASAGEEIIDFLAKERFYWQMCHYDDRGREFKEPSSIAFKMEVLMESVLEQRKMHVDRLMAAGDKRVAPGTTHAVSNNLKFADAEM